MRKFLAIAAVAAGMLVSVPATAQLNGIIGLLNGGRNVGNTLRYGCTGGGISQIACQAERARNISQQVDYQRQQVRARQQREEQQDERINQALERACRLGDQESCERGRPAADPRQTLLVQALDEACQAGDDVSCRRARTMSAISRSRRNTAGY